MHVVSGGSVTALHGCKGIWVSVWTPDDTVGVHVQLRTNASSGSLALDQRGEGYILTKGSVEYRKPTPEMLHRWKGGAFTEIDMPPMGPSGARWLELDSEGNPWISFDQKVYRREGESWVVEPLPPSEHGYDVIGGFGTGSPWVGLGELYMRSADKSWHAVTKPDGTYEGGWYVGVGEIHAVAPDDLFLEGRYPHEPRGRVVVQTVLYTTRPVHKVLTCKQE